MCAPQRVQLREQEPRAKGSAMPDSARDQDNQTARYWLRLPTDMKRRLTEASAKEERAIAVIIRRAISTELDRLDTLED